MKPKHSKQCEHSKLLLTVLIILSLVGIFVSVITIQQYYDLREGLPASKFCDLGGLFDCGAVNNSVYAALAGIPLGIYAIAIYCVIFALTVWHWRCKRKHLPLWLAMITGITFVYSLFLFAISKFVIGALCLYCTIIHLINFGLFITSIVLWLKEKRNGKIKK